MNARAFIAAFRNAFPTVALEERPDPSIWFLVAAKHPDVGPVCISEEGTEVSVAVGNITHGHFACYDTSLSEAEAESRVAGEVITFLRNLFTDRVQLWSGLGGAGGWRVLTASEQPKASRLPGVRSFLWSGPIQ